MDRKDIIVVWCGLDSSGSKQGPATGPCERSGFTEAGGFMELSYYYLLKKYSVPLS